MPPTRGTAAIFPPFDWCPSGFHVRDESSHSCVEVPSAINRSLAFPLNGVHLLLQVGDVAVQALACVLESLHIRVGVQTSANVFTNLCPYELSRESKRALPCRDKLAVLRHACPSHHWLLPLHRHAETRQKCSSPANCPTVYSCGESSFGGAAHSSSSSSFRASVRGNLHRCPQSRGRC